MRRMIDRRLLTLTAALSLAACAGTAGPQTDAAGQTTPAASGTAASGTAPSAPAQGQPVNADARAMAAFETRVKEYLALHSKLKDTLPHLPKEATPQQIDTHQRALARLVQDARRGAKRGDLFTPDVTDVVKRLLSRIFGASDGAALRTSIMDENPGKLALKVNGRYPDTVPLSTVPPQVLEGLPKLPEEMEFRFIGNRLVIMDVQAHIIVDFIENALPS